MRKNCLFCTNSEIKDIDNLECTIIGLINFTDSGKAENCEHYEEEVDDF